MGKVGREARAPWTPTRELKKRKSYFKRCGHMMETLEREKMKELAAERHIVPFRPGDVVKLTLEVPENNRRTQTFTGVCIAKKHRGLGSSFTLRTAIEISPLNDLFHSSRPTSRRWKFLNEERFVGPSCTTCETSRCASRGRENRLAVETEGLFFNIQYCNSISTAKLECTVKSIDICKFNSRQSCAV